MDLLVEIKKKFPLINFFNDKLEDWNVVTNKSENYKIDVIPELVKYRHQYLNENFVTQNLSMIFYDEKKTPIGIVPFSLTQKKQLILGNFSYELTPIIFVKNLSKKSRNNLFRKYLKIIEFIKIRMRIKTINFSINLSIPDDNDFFCFLLENDFQIVGKNFLINCKILQNIELNFKNFRDSYRPLIKSNKDNFKINFLSNSNFDKDIWLIFKSLHQKNAGRITRNIKTWDLQQKAIENGNAILSYIKSKDNFIGFAYFYLTNFECIYASAAFDKISKKKNLPVGHLIQYELIKYLIKRNIKWLKLGVYSDKILSSKEENIIKFKKGFSTHTMVEIRLEKK